MPRIVKAPDPRRDVRAGAAILALALAAATLGAALWPTPPERVLDPRVTALAPPLARFATVELVDGRRLATAGGIAPRDGEVRLRDARGERRVSASEIARAGTQRYWLGSDRYGRDVAARVLHGGRRSLAVAGASVLLALGIGVPLGLAAGLARGALAGVLLAFVDGARAFPRLFLVVALAAILRPSTGTTILILAATGWMSLARLVRAETRRIAAADYVLAARAAGVGPSRLAFRHVLPNALSPVGVEASLAMAGAIAAEAALAFLGLGAPPPAPSWGNLIADGRDLLADAPWISLAPGLALLITVLGCNLLAEGLRAASGPRRTTAAS
jgi:peptide/nickel transport system permease protein